MSTVTSASLTNFPPTTNSNPSVSSAGSSSTTFSFEGVVKGTNVQVVLSSNYAMDTASINSQRNGAVVTTNGVNRYLVLTVSTNDDRNWTVRARTGSDGSGNGVTFTAGTGGGFKKPK